MKNEGGWGHDKRSIIKPYRLPSLKLTFSHLKMDAWNTIVSFLGPGLFSGAKLLVLGSAYTFLLVNLKWSEEGSSAPCSRMPSDPIFSRDSWGEAENRLTLKERYGMGPVTTYKWGDNLWWIGL